MSYECSSQNTTVPISQKTSEPSHPLIYRGTDCNGMVRNRESGRPKTKIKQVLEVQKREAHDREEEREKEKRSQRVGSHRGTQVAQSPLGWGDNLSRPLAMINLPPHQSGEKWKKRRKGRWK
ncbi:hypothetical protein Q8A67_018244 [Cirrhinus molitorella]|uniref:Uncharacterized protein n=1 Tax=Cirrhinus molitorella TaxID=172907 RepID=A0AA88TEJ2_9TELE|nr:hypothetical protein Q8A67_018244 [Cirrhinus molitorella]